MLHFLRKKFCQDLGAEGFLPKYVSSVSSFLNTMFLLGSNRWLGTEGGGKVNFPSSSISSPGGAETALVANKRRILPCACITVSLLLLRHLGGAQKRDFPKKMFYILLIASVIKSFEWTVCSSWWFHENLLGAIFAFSSLLYVCCLLCLFQILWVQRSKVPPPFPPRGEQH